ncbi:MAG TPA: MFS transporter [Armatimonadota bacterium]|nr:MFS transporter [Armatimonadota bacterium]
MTAVHPKVALGKVTRRLIPFLFILYISAYLDRINVGFAQLEMKSALHFGDVVYATGAGIFFVGYFLFEIPSNLILHRIGARVWIARIMVTWGVISCCMMFVRTPASFYALRFLLGLAEAGFFPGMILYLTYWFPAEERARAVSRFMTATPLAGVIGGPLSGALLKLHGRSGLQGWQWLFLVEGIPSIILGFVTLFYLTDRPEKAHWLLPEERESILNELRSEQERPVYTLGQALSNPAVLLLTALYFAMQIGFYGFTMWLPLIIKGMSGMSDLLVGILSAAPYILAAIGMVVVGTHSDRTGERRMHVALSCVTAAAGLGISAVLQNPWIALASLSLAALGLWGTLGPFWAMPTAFLSGTAAAGGIALINSVGNLGGFVGPYAMGWLKQTTGGFTVGLFTLAGSLLVAALLAVSIRKRSDDGNMTTTRLR